MEKMNVGFSASQIKWIALIFMTIDHLDLIFYGIPFGGRATDLFRILGRISAPLFLYLLTESARYTRSKKRFILRLYCAGVASGMFTILTNLMLGRFLVYTPGNIFFTFFYTALLITSIESTKVSISQGSPLGAGSILLLCTALILLPQLFHDYTDGIRLFGNNIQAEILFRDVLHALFPSVLSIEYSIMFPLMGVMLYFAQRKLAQCILFIGFCFLSLAGSFIEGSLWPINDFVAPGQYWMILALPFIVLYNHKCGKSHKLFFYIYYPLHRYIFAILGTFLSQYL